MEYNPKNSVIAIFYFLFGSFLVWWFSSKITVFTSFFEDGLTKAIIYIGFIIIFATWVLLVPYLVLTNADISIKDFMQSIINFFIGLGALMILLPVASILIPTLQTMFDQPMISTLAWLICYGIVAYLFLIRPIYALVGAERLTT